MKLISLYVEQFGGLKQYRLNFEDGITLVQAENGFGKTTLAEFIRAMFYGFPRKTKTLGKRQKYLPWAGGKCAGNLEFEHGGIRYRIERTFGATPKSDTFRLLEAETNRPSSRFTENIGLELFGLDGDSFERSVYLPQSHEAGPLSTDSIRAKLGDLVEDASDVGNFEKAAATLRARRSSYVPYRGQGGAVMEALSQVSRTQMELDRAAQAKEELARLRQEITLREEEKQAAAQALAEIRGQITQAAEAAAVAAAQRQHSQLAAQAEQLQQAVRSLQTRYPRGFPSRKAMEQARQQSLRELALAGKEQAGEEPQLRQAAARYQARFAAGIPTRRQLEQQREACNVYLTLTAQTRSLTLSGAERQELETLREPYEQGLLEERYLDGLSEISRELDRSRHQLDTLAPDSRDAARLAELDSHFAASCPTPEEIEEQKQKLRSLDRLQEELENLTAIPLELAPQKSLLAPALALILGAAGLILGIVLLVQQRYLPGGLSAGLGILALILGAVLGIKTLIARELGNQRPEVRQQLAENRRTAEALERQIQEFAARWGIVGPTAGCIYELEDLAEEYRDLQNRRQELEARRADLTQQVIRLTGKLEAALGPRRDFSRAIRDAHLQRERYLDLTEEERRNRAESEALQARADGLARQIREFLSPYFAESGPDSWHQQLDTLAREAEDCLRTQARLQELTAEREAHQQELARCRQQLDAFFEDLALTRQADVQTQLADISQDMGSLSRLQQQLEQARQEQNDYRNTHRRELEAPAVTETPEVEPLKAREREQNRTLDKLTEDLLALRQRCGSLRELADRIPELEDSLQLWQEKKLEAQKQAALLDGTLEFLQQAKDSLSSSYLGPIRQAFNGYMELLTGTEAGRVLIDPDLQLQPERQGQARELGYFSAGQTDILMLCMRLALVDALFGGEETFVILDDPFVNLDDKRTAAALSLLQELSRKRQILYLVCNSSRSL